MAGTRPHPLVDQLRFARSEFRRGLAGVPEVDGERRIGPMNSIGWMVGHLAWHEQLLWLRRGQERTPRPDLDETVGNGRPASTPSLGAMWAAWDQITAAADPFLDELAPANLLVPLPYDRRPAAPTAGTQLLRITYHYWVHTGEATAVRQVLGHVGVPEFVGDIDTEAPFRPA